MFVMFECGCIGMRITDPADPAAERLDFVIKACDADGPELGIYGRDMGDKGTVPLSFARTLDILRTIDLQARKGYKYDQIRALLGVPQ